MVRKWNPGMGFSGALSWPRRVTSAGALSLSLALAAAPAGAFCRTTTCDRATECEYDALGCPSVGVPLAWKSGCVSYSVNRSASPKRGIDYETTHAITARAFARWTAADCRGNAPSIDISDLSPASCGEPEYNSDAPNANVIMFRDGNWPEEYDPAAVAHTVITFHTDTGEIFDADIEVNSFGTDLTTSDANVGFDLESIIVHEAGHFLGLDHSHLGDATMFFRQAHGDISLRDLVSDDANGICSMYPPDRNASTTACSPRHGFSPNCGSPEDEGCAVAGTPGGSKRAWPLAVMLALGTALGVVRRRRSSNPRA
ncbi:MAG TPA: matrixin family metalloprotease [Polyangiaceae bacterium]